MRIKVVILLVITFALCSCSSIKTGVYKTTCDIYHVPQLILLLNDDNTFEYKRPYVEEKIVGTWEVNEKKELILKSKMFSIKDEFSPDYKFTDNEGNDIYKIKGNKLLTYNTNGKYTKDKCHLIHINNDVTLFKDYKFFKNQ